jgi:hypothetical protein
MEDGMDFSPQRNSHEHNRSSFGSDGYEFTVVESAVVPPKQQSANSGDKLKSTKPKNTKPDQPEKASPPGATNPSHGNNKTATALPASDHAAGATAAVAATSAGGNTEQAAAGGNQETSGGARSNATSGC